MAELKQVLAMRGNLPLVLLQNPSGSWSFAGRVPMHLSYRMIDGSPVSDDLARDIVSFGAGLFRSKIRSVVFTTESDAVAEANRLGFEVKQVSRKQVSNG